MPHFPLSGGPEPIRTILSTGTLQQIPGIARQRNLTLGKGEGFPIEWRPKTIVSDLILEVNLLK